MITHLLIKGLQGSGKTTLANIIKELSPEKVLIADDMSIEEVKLIITEKDNKIELIIETTSDADYFGMFGEEGNRRINKFISISII